MGVNEFMWVFFWNIYFYLCNILLWVAQMRPNILEYRCASILCRCSCEFFYILTSIAQLHQTDHDESGIGMCFRFKNDFLLHIENGEKRC